MVTVCTHSVQHAHNVFCVCERTNLFVALAINYSEGLQTQALHRNFGRQQKAMVKLVEELVSERKRSKSSQFSMGFERTHTEYTIFFFFPLRSFNGIGFFIFILLKQQAKVIIPNLYLIRKALVFHLQVQNISTIINISKYFQHPPYPAFGSSHICPHIIRHTNLKLLVVPGDDVGAAELAVHTEGAHLRLQGVPQLLPRLQVPNEVGLRVVQLESLTTEELVSMVSSKRMCIQFNSVKGRNRPVVEKLPVDFDFYSLPSLPQDDWLLVRVLQTNKSKSSDSQYFSLMKR